MKNIIFKYKVGLLALSIWLVNCQKQDVSSEVLPPTIEAITVYSVSTTNAEINIDIANVKGKIDEVGVVWSESPKPTISDKRIIAGIVNEDQSLLININDLILNRSYYLRAYYLINDQATYSNEVTFIHNFTNEWSKIVSLRLDKNEYVLSEHAFFESAIGGIKVDKVNKDFNTTKLSYYFPDNFQWDPPFLNIPSYLQDHTNFMRGQSRFNQIFLTLDIGQNLTAKIIGAGHYQSIKGEKTYLKDIIFYGLTGYKWEPFYPGSDANTTSISLGKNGYILENIPKGKLWNVNFEFGLKWTVVSEYPYQKKAKSLGVASNGNIYFIVEPDDWKEESVVEFYEYNTIKNLWTKKANFTGQNRRKGVFFVVNNRIFYGTGQSVKTLAGLRDIWEYIPTNNSWKKVADYPGGGTVNLLPVEYVDNSIFLGFGHLLIPNKQNSEIIKDMADFWKFKPIN